MINEPALRDNVVQICERVRALRPRRILDLGCGSGLLLFPLAPDCERYVGVDFSAEAIADLTGEAAHRGLTGLQLFEQAVDDPSNIEEGYFDVVLLNTVIQYFPDTAYLRTVLNNALRALRLGGVIFVGDVRDLGSLDAFHASIVQGQARPNDDLHTLQSALRRIAERESELVFDIGWFEVFAASHPDISAVQMAHKQGRFRNELVDYRYDVILRKGGSPAYVTPDMTISGEADLSDVDDLLHGLTKNSFRTILIKGLLNASRKDAFDFLQSIEEAKLDRNNGARLDLKRGLLIKPNELIESARVLGYLAIILPDAAGSPAQFTVFLVREDQGATLWSHRPLRTHEESNAGTSKQ